jgi:uncharacterized membrane protein
MLRHIELAIGWLMALKADSRQAQRGLSQSTEIAILLAAALAIAVAIGGIVTMYVKNKLEGFG